MRALRTLKALQAGQAAAAEVLEMPPPQPRAPARLAPNEPARRPEPAPERRLEYVLPAAPAPGHTLHEPAACWTPNEPEPHAAQQFEVTGAPASTRSGEASAPRSPRVAWTA
jgi:hypothetical protein